MDRKKELEDQIRRCEEVMWSNDIDAKELEIYQAYHKQLLEELSRISNEKRTNLIKTLEIGIQGFTALATVGMFVYDRSWSKRMMIFMTNWEDGNTMTKTSGKLLEKSLLPKKF